MSTTEPFASGKDLEQTNYAHTAAVAIQVSQDVVVASIQVDLKDDVLARFQQDLLQRIHSTNSHGVILDLSGLETLDSHEFAGLRRIIKMSEILGAQAVMVGLRPGVVSALIGAGADTDGLKAALNLDAAYAMLRPESVFEPEPDGPLDDDSDEGTRESSSEGIESNSGQTL